MVKTSKHEFILFASTALMYLHLVSVVNQRVVGKCFIHDIMSEHFAERLGTKRIFGVAKVHASSPHSGGLGGGGGGGGPAAPG